MQFFCIAIIFYWTDEVTLYIKRKDNLKLKLYKVMLFFCHSIL